MTFWHSQCWWQPTPQRPESFITSDLHKSILWHKNNCEILKSTFRGIWTVTKTELPEFSGSHTRTHKGPAEMRWCFVPAGAAGSVLTNIDVIHQPVTIQETLPCKRHNHSQQSAKQAITATYGIQFITNSESKLLCGETHTWCQWPQRHTDHNHRVVLVTAYFACLFRAGLGSTIDKLFGETLKKELHNLLPSQNLPPGNVPGNKNITFTKDWITSMEHLSRRMVTLEEQNRTSELKLVQMYACMHNVTFANVLVFLCLFWREVSVSQASFCFFIHTQD